MKTASWIMTQEEWKKEKSRLQGLATRAKKQVTATMFPRQYSLDEKVVALKLHSLAQEALRNHKLNYFDLVKK